MRSEKAREIKPSVYLSPDVKEVLDRLAQAHSIKLTRFLGLVVHWLDRLTKTERAIVLGQLDADDELPLLSSVIRRRLPSDTREADQYLQGLATLLGVPVARADRPGRPARKGGRKNQGSPESRR